MKNAPMVYRPHAVLEGGLSGLALLLLRWRGRLSFTRFSFYTALCACALLLSSCLDGGGGSGGSGGTNIPPPNAHRVSQIADVDRARPNRVRQGDSAGALTGLTVYATDEDPERSSVHYVLVDSNGGNFAIGRDSGVVTLAVSGTLMTGDDPMITVEAISADGSTSRRTFTIEVAPVNMFPVGAVSDTDVGANVFLETDVAGTTVGITLFAEDEDLAGNQVRYALGDASGVFEVDADTGEVVLAVDSSSLSEMQYSFRGIARSEDGSTSSAVFTVMRLGDVRPRLAIHFPTPRSLVTTDTAHVRGTARAVAGRTLSRVTAALDGSALMVDLSADGSWSLVAPGLAEGDNEIAVTATDSQNETRELTIVVNLYTATAPPGILFGDLFGLVYDPAGERVFVVDEDNDAIVAVDMDTGARTIISGGSPAVGTGIALGDMEGGIVLDTTVTPPRLLVTENNANALMAIDIANGNRSVISRSGSGARGSGPAFATPLGVALDTASGRAFVSDSGSSVDGIIEVDLDSGDRTLFASTPETGRVTDLQWDSANQRLVAVDADEDIVLAISSTGVVSVISPDPAAGQPGDFGTPRGMVLHTISGTLSALVANDGSGDEAITIVNLEDGSRRFLVDFGTEADPRDVVIDASATPPRIIMASDDPNELFEVSLSDGSFSEIDAPPPPVPPAAIGTGPSLMSPTGLVLDAERNRLLVADDGRDAVVSVSLASANRAIFSDDDGAVDFSQPRGTGLDLERGELLVVDNGGGGIVDTLFGVDLVSGMRRVISSNSDGATPTFGSPRGSIVVRGTGANAEALVVDTARDRLFGVHLSTRARRNILQLSNGLLEGIQNVVHDPAVPDQVIISGASATNAGTADVILALDVANVSSRTVLASSGAGDVPDPGSGPAMTNPRGIAVDGARIVVYDADLNQVIALDKRTLVRTVIAPPAGSVDYLRGDANPSVVGGLGSVSNAVVLDAQRRVLYAVNPEASGVIVLDLVSGAQSVVSR